MKKTYAYHKPSQEGLETIQMFRQAYSAMHATIEKFAPDSRERSIALTNLETSAMWAIKAVVCNDPNSEIETPPATKKEMEAFYGGPMGDQIP